MGKSVKTPPPPDPVKVAQAQTQSNIETAREQQRLNMVNTHGPQGSVVYAADPNAPGGFSQNTTLSPAEQATYERQKLAENGALDTANAQLQRVNDALATPLSTDGLPTLHGGGQLSVGKDMVFSFDKGGPLQYGFDAGQQIQGAVGGDLEQARRQAADAAYGQAASRLDPMWDRRESQLDAKLAAQGISGNSDAARTARMDFGRDRNDAYNQAAYSSIGAGENAAQAMFGRQLSQGQFANQAAGQQYQQSQGLAAFNNQAAGQDYSQNLGAAQFTNQAQNQRFNQELARAQLANTARQQGLQERAYIQNQPINQFTGLLGLGQVGNPQGIAYSPTQVQGTDVVGAHALSAQVAQQNAALKAQAQGGLMGGLFQLGSAAIMSDRRAKTDIRRVGTRPDGLGVYLYRYKAGGPETFGVMAQEVAKVRPEAVIRGSDGFLRVHYALLEAA